MCTTLVLILLVWCGVRDVHHLGVDTPSVVWYGGGGAGLTGPQVLMALAENIMSEKLQSSATHYSLLSPATASATPPHIPPPESHTRLSPPPVLFSPSLTPSHPMLPAPSPPVIFAVTFTTPIIEDNSSSSRPRGDTGESRLRDKGHRLLSLCGRFLSWFPGAAGQLLAAGNPDVFVAGFGWPRGPSNG